MTVNATNDYFFSQILFSVCPFMIFFPITLKVTSGLVCVCVAEQVKERPDVGVYVKDLSAFVVNNADDMDRIMTLGNKNSEFLSPAADILISCHFGYAFLSC